jgi:hypothetical protein
MKQITQKDVEFYRHIYYNIIKPLIKLNKSASEIDKTILPHLMENNWTLEIYHDFQSIDILQRIAYYSDCVKLSGKKQQIQIMTGKDIVDIEKFNIFSLPELRCPIRSEE